MSNLRDKAIEREIERHKRQMASAIDEIRSLLHRIEGDLEADRKPTVSSSNLWAELFNLLGQYEAAKTAQEIVDATKASDGT